MWRLWDHCVLPVRKENAAAEETVWQFLRSRITLWSSISTSGYIPKRVKSKTQGDNCPSVFIAALFTRPKGGSNPSVYWQMNEKLKCCVYIRWICNVRSVFSCVWLFVAPWTVAHQVPLSMGLSMQEYWSGLSFPTPGDLPNPGIKPASLALLALEADSLPLRHLGSLKWMWFDIKKEGNSDTCYNMDEPWGYYANEISQSHTKNNYPMVPLTWGIKVVKFIEIESRMVRASPPGDCDVSRSLGTTAGEKGGPSSVKEPLFSCAVRVQVKLSAAR